MLTASESSKCIFRISESEFIFGGLAGDKHFSLGAEAGYSIASTRKR
jgi:hypothetical protein